MFLYLFNLAQFYGVQMKLIYYVVRALLILGDESLTGTVVSFDAGASY